MSGSRGKTVLAILAAVLLAGPGAFSPPAAQAQIKNLNIGIGIDADTLNPQEHTTTLPMNISDLIHDNLFFATPDGKLEPRLATDYKVSEDGLTVTLKLRQGVKFSDGTPYDAKAQKLTIDRGLDPKLKVPLRSYISMIQECVVVDDYTIQLKLKYPFAPLIPTFSVTILSPISPKAIEQFGEDVRQKPVGAGPYVLKEWVKGDRIVLTRNENYWGPKPTVEQLTYRIVPEVATREAMLRAGQIDVCYKPSPANVAALKADSSLTVEMPLSTRTIFMALRGDRPLMKNKLVRQALNYAVDKKTIVKRILFDTAEPMDGTVSPLMFGYAKMESQYEYNPEKAKELLKQANWDFNQVVKIGSPQGRYLFDKEVAEAIQAQFQAIGVKTELRVADWPTFIAAVYLPLERSEWDMVFLGWGPIILDADAALYAQFTSAVYPPKGLGSAFYTNPEYDKILEESRTEQNLEKRKALLAKGSKIVWDDCPWIWLHVEKFVIAYSAKIKGMIVTPTERFYPGYITMK
jgi:ABC-type transport system substrate-binding protein